MLSVQDDRLLTVPDLARRMQVPVSWVYAQTRTGRIPHLRAGRMIRFRWPDVEAWMADQADQVGGMVPD